MHINQMFPNVPFKLSQLASASPQASQSPANDHDSRVLAERFLLELVRLDIFKPKDPSKFDIKNSKTHEGKWQPAPNLHEETPPSHKAQYETKVAEFFQELLHFLDRACHRARIDKSGHIFKASANHPITDTSQKPDIILLKKSIVGKPSFTDVRAVIEVKYKWSALHCSDAILAIGDKSWFMLDACDQRVHTIGAAFCGSTFTPCMLDRGGFLSGVDIDIEVNPLPFLQCLSVMGIGSKRAAGYDEEWGLDDKISMEPIDDDKRGSEKLFTVHARTFSHRALTGRSTRVIIASWNDLFQPNTDEESSDDIDIGNSDGSQSLYVRALTALHNRLFLPPRNQVAIKDCWPYPGAYPEGYILDCLGGENLKSDPSFSRLQGIPTKLVDRFVKGYDPLTGENVVDSTLLRRRTTTATNPEFEMPKFEDRVHYRLAMEEVCVDLSWFSHRVEFFTAILKALKAHKFAVLERKILHQDIGPPNIWLYIRTLDAALAVPEWYPGPVPRPPPVRLAFLGDWGMAAPLEGFDSKIEQPISLEGEPCFKGYSVNPDERTGTVPFIATELLMDQWGEQISHRPQHDLESFWWTTLWSTCNFSGPYHQVRPWPQEEESGMSAAGIVETVPSWLRPGNGHLKFRDIVASRLSFAGAFARLSTFVAPYWQVDPVLEGLREMSQLFLPNGLAISSGNMLTKMGPVPEVTHDQMIDIVDKIIQGLSNIQELPPSSDLVSARRSAWSNGIRLTNHAMLASYGKASNSLYATFRPDMSLSTHESSELFHQTLAGPPRATNKRRRGEAESESESKT